MPKFEKLHIKCCPEIRFCLDSINHLECLDSSRPHWQKNWQRGCWQAVSQGVLENGGR